MNANELRELMQLLKDAGIEALLCDTPLPLYVGKGNCGVPLEAGDDVDEMVPVPRALLGWGLQYFVRAKGDSMKGLGIDEGDLLRVDAAMTARDGDVVVAYLDREVTVKTLTTDEEGTRWLVPANEHYQAICLADNIEVKMLGVVVANEKQPPRMEMKAALQAIRRAKQAKCRPLDETAVERALRGVAGYVLLKRHWIGVYRALKDRGAEVATGYETFCACVCRVLPQHPNLPTVRELQRMDVQSFSKPLRLWDRHDAPVDGKRFDEYVSIARRFLALLREQV